MRNGPARRQVLKAVAASSIVAPVAGCLDTLEATEDAPGSTGDAESDARSVPHESACAAGRELITALGDGDFETVVSYYPYEHLEDESIDEASLTEDLEDSDWGPFGWVDGDGEIRELTCECAESYPESDQTDLAADVTGDVTDLLELRYAVTYDADGETATDSAFVDAVEIDGDWFAVISYFSSTDLCGTGSADGRGDDTDSGRESDEEEAREQSLEPADWADVDEIVLEANVAGWVGVEPAPIEGIENPTLLLFEGREYGFEWRNGDGAAHNLAILDSNEEALVATDVTDDESASLAVEATSAMDSYACEPHLHSMFGDIEIASE